MRNIHIYIWHSENTYVRHSKKRKKNKKEKHKRNIFNQFFFLFEKKKSDNQQPLTACLILKSPQTLSLLKLVAEDIIYTKKQIGET